MDSTLLIESLTDFAKVKRIDKGAILEILEEVIRTFIRKKYRVQKNFDVTIDAEKGEIRIIQNREVIDDNSEDIWDNDKISLSEAKKIDPDFEIGHVIAKEINVDDLFGRKAVGGVKQFILDKVKDIEKRILYKKYKERVGEIITCSVHQVFKKALLLKDIEGNELTLPQSELIPKDRFRKGDNVKAVVHIVEMAEDGSLKITLSRTSPLFLQRLLENEVPELYDGLILIKKIVREPGEKAKVAVESYDERIDPVGACVGVRGVRVNNVTKELQYENIDLVHYTENLELYVSRAINPAKVLTTKIDTDKNRIIITLKPDQVSLAIGKGGNNIKLASKLVGYEIEIYRDSEYIQNTEEDVDLNEFTDEIEEWIITEFKKIGLDTAKSVLSHSVEDLARRTDLEEETIKDVLDILTKEFETTEKESKRTE
ncbi:MAG: transcription termination factor NusA [Chitinophagaceae bacterium]|nr:transcription termination factor NusA [Chitinophagaceae bacterium]